MPMKSFKAILVTVLVSLGLNSLAAQVEKTNHRGAETAGKSDSGDNGGKSSPTSPK